MKLEREYYEEIYRIQAAQRSVMGEGVGERSIAEEDESLRFMASLELCPKEAESIIDVGSGDGAFLSMIVSQRKLHHLGVDRSANAVALCKDLNPGLNVMVGDISKLESIDDRSFDIVSCLEVLEHLPCESFIKARKEIGRISRRWVVISIPFEERRVFVKCPSCDTKFNPSLHLRTFNRKGLESLIDGFKLIEGKLISARKAYVPDFLIGAYAQHASAFSLCPICGFNPNHTKEMVAQPQRKAGFFMKHIPRRSKVRWIVCLFEREGKC